MSTKKESPAQSGTTTPVFGVHFELSNPTELEKAIALAEKHKFEAKCFFEQSRKYLMQCTARVNELKVQMVHGKEVCHG